MSLVRFPALRAGRDLSARKERLAPVWDAIGFGTSNLDAVIDQVVADDAVIGFWIDVYGDEGSPAAAERTAGFVLVRPAPGAEQDRQVVVFIHPELRGAGLGRAVSQAAVDAVAASSRRWSGSVVFDDAASSSKAALSFPALTARLSRDLAAAS